MKKRLVALGMAAVMVVGGSVMAFAYDPADDPTTEDSAAEIEFVLRLGNEVRPPDDGDLPPDWPSALRTMDLDFGIRDLLVMTQYGNTFYTHDGPTGGGDNNFGDAIARLYDDEGEFDRYGVPALENRTMGVTFESNSQTGFYVNVSRTAFVSETNVTVLGAAVFSLLEYRNVYVAEGDGPITITNPVTVTIGNEARVAEAGDWGTYTASFSGRLTNVARAQIPADSYQTVLTWVMQPQMP